MRMRAYGLTLHPQSESSNWCTSLTVISLIVESEATFAAMAREQVRLPVRDR